MVGLSHDCQLFSLVNRGAVSDHQMAYQNTPEIISHHMAQLFKRQGV